MKHGSKRVQTNFKPVIGVLVCKQKNCEIMQQTTATYWHNQNFMCNEELNVSGLLEKVLWLSGLVIILLF